MRTPARPRQQYQSTRRLKVAIAATTSAAKRFGKAKESGLASQYASLVLNTCD